MRKNSVLKNVTALGVMQIANYALPLITLPYLVKVLGPEKFGLLAFVQAFITYFVILTDYGFNLSATKAVSENCDDYIVLSRIASSVMIIKTILMTLGLIIMTLMLAIIPTWRENWELFFLFYLMSIGSLMFPIWLFQGIEKMSFIMTINIAARSITTVAIFIFVHNTSDYKIAAGIQASTLVIAGIISLILLPSVIKIGWRWPGLGSLKETLNEGWHVFLATGGASLFNNSNVFIIGLLTTPTIVGYFAAAEKLVKAVVGLNAPITQAVFPHIARLQKTNEGSMMIFTAKLIKYQAGVMLLASAILFLTAEQLTTLLFGTEFKSSILFIQILSALPLLTALSDILGNQIMLNNGMQKQFATSLISSGIINLILMTTLIQSIGGIGAPISILITEIILLSIRARYLSNKGILQQLRKKIYA